MTNMTWAGQTLSGRYRIEELLGHGGMSSVFKATDPNLRRTVAIKIIHPHLSSNPDFLSRFEEEAAMVAQLRHENIIQVFDFNHEGDVYYMVLEYLPGETLGNRLKRLNDLNQKMDPMDAVKDVAQVCDAVQYAHDKGLIHRDIKPANIMLSVYGKAVLMDFGIARMVGGSQHTATGAVIGTAKYMSPEQIKGEKVDGRSDIYSLGVTLFEAVSGKPPFEADSVMTLMMMHINDPVPDIRQLQPHVPESLVLAVDKAMEKNPQNRYQTAAEMAAALRGVYKTLTGEVIQAPISRDPDVVPTLVAPPVERTYAEQAVPVITPPPVEPVSAVEQTLPARAVPKPAHYSIQPDPAAGSVPQEAKPVSGPAAQRSRSRIPIFIGVGLLVALLVIGAIAYAGFSLLGRSNLASLAPPTAGTQNSAALQTGTASQGAVVPTLASTAVPTAVAVVKPTATPVPLASPTGQPATAFAPAAATSTINPNGESVRIDNITVQGGRYVVDYETFGFTEVLPGTNIHFFFNTVPPDQAGVPGKGPWAFFGGPRPFKGYAVANRPQGATQMCALVANADHTVQAQSGNCFNLPNP